MSEETELSQIPQDEDAESKRKRREARNERMRAEDEAAFERNFRRIADEMRLEGATDEEILRKRHAARRMSGPSFTNAWHADGTPYSEEDYIRAGMQVPLDVDEQKPIRVVPRNNEDSDL